MPHTMHKKGGTMTLDGANYAVAAAAISSPLWLQNLGNVAADVVPVLGAIWLVVQIAHKLANWSSKHDDRKGTGQ